MRSRHVKIYPRDCIRYAKSKVGGLPDWGRGRTKEYVSNRRKLLLAAAMDFYGLSAKDKDRLFKIFKNAEVGKYRSWEDFVYAHLTPK